MKLLRFKIYLIIILIISLFFLAGCTGGGNIDSLTEGMGSLHIKVEGQGVVEVDGKEVKDELVIDYEKGEEVILKADADDEWYFEGWGESLSGNSSPEKVVVDDDMTIIANFDDVELSESAKIVSDEEADSIEEISFDNNEIVFKDRVVTENQDAYKDEVTFESQTSFLNDLEEGDILIVDHEVPGAEKGFLEEVTYISNDGKSVKIEPATLDDAVKNGEFSTTETLTFSDAKNNISWAEGVSNVEVNNIEEKFNFEFSPPDNEDLSIEGYLVFREDTNFNLNLKYTDGLNSPEGLEEFEFVLEPGFEVDMNFIADNSVSWEGEHELATIEGPPISVYGPITITPEITLIIGANGEVGTELSTGINYDRNYEVGISYERENWDTIKNHSGEGFQIKEPDFVGKASAEIFSKIELTGMNGVRKVGEAGLGSDLSSGIKTTGEIDPDISTWEWAYDVNMTFKAGVHAKLEVLQVADVSWDGPYKEFYSKNLAYGASGRATKDGNGLKGVNIKFEGGSFDGVTTDENGYWSKHLLQDDVTIIPEKEGYSFDPESKRISESASNVDFEAIPAKYLLSIDAKGLGTLSPPEGSHEYEHGEEVKLEANPDENWNFDGWEGDISSGDRKESIIMDEDKEVTALFKPIEEDGMVLVGAGTTSSENGSITLEENIYMDKHHVTQAEFENVMGFNPSESTGDSKPVEMVSWYDAVMYCNKLSESEGLSEYYNISDIEYHDGKTGPEGSIKSAAVTRNDGANGYRLPTEREHEFAARGGNAGEPTAYAGSDSLDEVGWYGDNASSPQSVGQKDPNELYLYDMSGNVYDWTDTSDGDSRVIRGGSWAYDAEYCEVNSSWNQEPQYNATDTGFRVVRPE